MFAREFFSGGPGQKLLASGFDVNVLRTNDLLRKDEWKALDDAVVQVARRQLGALEDVRAAGLTRNLGSLGVLLDEYERVSDVDPAEQSMAGVTPGQRDQAAFELASVPVPITFRDFQINLRQLAASRRGNSAIDTTNSELCARRVMEKLEDTLFNGSTVSIGGNTLAGLTTATARITGSVTAAWSSATGEQILGDVIDMIADAEAQNYFGGFMLYVPVSWNAALRGDLKAGTDKMIRERLLEIDALQGIRGTASLTAEAVLVQMTRDVLDLSIASDITTVQWDSMGGMISNFKVMAAMAPRIKAPYGSGAKTGIVHYS
jgi:uncharacterized linocin/CFP29 family protein